MRRSSCNFVGNWSYPGVAGSNPVEAILKKKRLQKVIEARNNFFKSDLERYKKNVIIVEGKRDAEALRNLGFEKVFEMHSVGTSIIGSIERIFPDIERTDEISVLTDFDDAGEKFCKTIRALLQENGFKVDLTFRNKLMLAGFSHVEGIVRQEN